MAQYRVPQNIFMPDRIIGPFTLAQFLYLFSAGALDLILFYTLGTISFALFVISALIVSGIGLALTFVKINDQPFHKILLAAAAFYAKPRERAWNRLGELERPVVKAAPPKRAAPAARPPEAEVRSKLKSLALMLDTQGWQSLKEKRPEIAGIKTVDVPGGIPKEAKPIVPPVAKEVALPTEIGRTPIPSPVKEIAPLEITPPLPSAEEMTAPPGVSVPAGGPIPPAKAPEVEFEKPRASAPYFVPPGEEL